MSNLIVWKPFSQAKIGDVILLNDRSEIAIITSLAPGKSKDVLQVGWTELEHWESAWSSPRGKLTPNLDTLFPFLDLNYQIESTSRDLMQGDVILYHDPMKGYSTGLIELVSFLGDPLGSYELKLTFMDEGESFYLWMHSGKIQVLQPRPIPSSIQRARDLKKGDYVYTGGFKTNFRTVERVEPTSNPDMIRVYYRAPGGMEGIKKNRLVEIGSKALDLEADRGHLYRELWLT